MAQKLRKKENVEAYRHETKTRKNVVWTGKAENKSFEVPTVSLPIHERIAPEITMQRINEATDMDLKVVERLRQMGWKRVDTL